MFGSLGLVQYPAYAQSAPGQARGLLPGSVDPSRFDQRFSEEQDRQGERIVAPGDLDLTETIPEAPDGFQLTDITLAGVSVYPAARFDELIAEYTGRKVNIETLNHLAGRIMQIYRDDGYFLSRVIVPRQEVTDGMVRLRVLEGFVNNVRIEDPDGILPQPLSPVLRESLEQMADMNPLHGPTMERYILLLNDGAGVAFNSILNAPGDPAEPGAVDIILEVAEKEPVTSLGYNNYGSRFVGPHQANAGYSIGSILNPLDTLTLQASTSLPFDELQFGAISYESPLTPGGLRGRISASYARSNPGASLEPLEIEGRSLTLETGVSYPLIRSRETDLSVGGSFIFKQSQTEFLDRELIDDKIRALSFNIEYKTLDPLEGVNEANINVTKGMDIFNASETGSENLSRAQARSDFVKLEAGLNRRQEVFDNFQINTKIFAQYAPHPLPSSQEFGYGGTVLGRAYDPSEILGDQGISAGAELLYTNLETLPVSGFDLKLNPFVFYDIGKVWNEDRNSPPVSGASAGFGTYYNFSSRVSGSLQVAWPLTKNINTPIMNGPDGPRFLFSIQTTF